jgi:hypothetical protein
MSELMSNVRANVYCRDFVGTLSGLCRDFVGTLSGLCLDFVWTLSGLMSNVRANVECQADRWLMSADRWLMSGRPVPNVRKTFEKTADISLMSGKPSRKQLTLA